MPYIDYDYYAHEFEGKPVDEAEFKRYQRRASDVIDYLTSFKLKGATPYDGLSSFLKEQVMKATAAQVEYFVILGATTFEEINNSPQTFSAGRTSVSNASRYNPSGSNESKPLVAEDVYFYLKGTGLLYSGVGVQ